MLLDEAIIFFLIGWYLRGESDKHTPKNGTILGGYTNLLVTILIVIYALAKIGFLSFVLSLF